MNKRKRTAAGGSKKNSSFVLKITKGTVFGLLITVAAVLLLAYIVKSTGMSDQTISAFNQAIKIISIFVSALVASRGLCEKYILSGALAGGGYVILGYLTFSLIEGRLGDLILMLTDLAMGVVIGMITALIFGKLLKSNKPASIKGAKRAY